jgi:GNAT superfamily N-acetyltransferase
MTDRHEGPVARSTPNRTVTHSEAEAIWVTSSPTRAKVRLRLIRPSRSALAEPSPSGQCVRVTIRPFNASDTIAVVGLSLRAWAPVHISIREALGPEINDALQPDWRAKQLRDVEEVLSAPSSNVWVADLATSVAGFVAVRIHDDRRIGEIDMLAVDPPHQGAGIGTALTTFAVDWIKASGIGVAMVGTGADPGHAPARRTYEKAGMKLVPMARYFMKL